MGYQLWTSPITGYRRRGTRLAELRKLLDSGITAHAILEPLQSCPAEADAVEMARALDSKDFDIAGVQVQKDGPLIGFVFRENLQNGIVQNHLQQFTEKHLIADSTSLASILSVLKSRESVFVLIGPDVKGVVTRADLNKPAMRIYLFGLISLLEMHLTFWVKNAYPQDTWKEKLLPIRLKKAESLQKLRRSRNQETSLVDCLQFCDKRDLLLACREPCETLGLENIDESCIFFEQAEDLRNLLAHSQQDLVDGSSWEELFELIKRIESLIHLSDEFVEKEAKKIANNFVDELWASA